jgi:hypothetical protein
MPEIYSHSKPGEIETFLLFILNLGVDCRTLAS